MNDRLTAVGSVCLSVCLSVCGCLYENECFYTCSLLLYTTYIWAFSIDKIRAEKKTQHLIKIVLDWLATSIYYLFCRTLFFLAPSLPPSPAHSIIHPFVIIVIALQPVEPPLRFYRLKIMSHCCHEE